MSQTEIKAVVIGIQGPAGGGTASSGGPGVEIIQLTEAEYQALPAEEQMDVTKLYFIVD